MHFSTAVLAALALVLPVLAAPNPAVTVQRSDGDTTGRYLVKLRNGISRSSVLNSMNITATHEWTIINGFAGYLSDEQIQALYANPSVESISEDGITYPLVMDDTQLGALLELDGTRNVNRVSRDGKNPRLVVSQNDATWGLARLSTIARIQGPDPYAFTFTYTYNETAGNGVDIYVLDTGVCTAHAQFGGRARWGATFGPYPSQDIHGHGTHNAGTAAGIQVGVAKEASIIAVKVLGTGDVGTGTTADLISGMSWVLTSAQASGRPSIASIAIGSVGVDPIIDAAVTGLTNAGIHVIIGAGNSNVDASNFSPARAPSAITVGASNINDARATFSNWGAVVDIFAPGQSIMSAWIGNPDAGINRSGSSQSASHISGLVATLISSEGNLTPAAMATKVRNLALNGVLANMPAGTVNRLAQNGLAQPV